MKRIFCFMGIVVCSSVSAAQVRSPQLPGAPSDPPERRQGRQIHLADFFDGLRGCYQAHPEPHRPCSAIASGFRDLQEYARGYRCGCQGRSCCARSLIRVLCEVSLTRDTNPRTFVQHRQGPQGFVQARRIRCAGRRIAAPPGHLRVSSAMPLPERPCPGPGPRKSSCDPHAFALRKQALRRP